MNIPNQKLGETRSGKPICTFTTEDAKTVVGLTADFTAADRFDAMALLQYLAIRALRRAAADPHEFGRYAWHASIHMNLISKEDLQKEMRSLSLVTSIGVSKHGKSRADHIFVD